MPTLITGASGHLGANLVRALIKRGDSVRVLLRRDSDNRAVEGLEVERVYGDLRNDESLRRAVEGCAHVYHLAAFVSIRSGDKDCLHDINVLGARRLMRACREAGVRKVVHCSSIGAIGHNPEGPSTEEWFLHPFEDVMDYDRSKAFAEWEVYREIARGLPAVIVNPSTVVGPWDYGPSILGSTIVAFAKGKMSAYVDGAYDFVAARDVVDGLLLAMEKGRIGERYILSGENVSVRQTLDWLEELTGVKKPSWKIPAGLLQNAAIVKDWVERTFFPQVTPRFNYHSIRLLRSGKYSDAGKATRELGLEFTPVKEGYREAVEWFREHGYC